jgi:hypothetical protein
MGMKRYTALSCPVLSFARRLGAILTVAMVGACSSGGGGSSSSGADAPVTAESLQGNWLFCDGDANGGSVMVLTAQDGTLSADPFDGDSPYGGTYHEMSGAFDSTTRLWTPDYFDESSMDAPDGAPLENDYAGDIVLTFDVTGTRFVGTTLDAANGSEVPLNGGRDDGSFNCSSSSGSSSSKCAGVPTDCENQQPGACMNGCNLVLGVGSMPNSCGGSPDPCSQLGDQSLCLQAGCRWSN